MAAEGDRIIWFNYTGGDRRVPDDATHVTVDQSVRVIPAWAFSGHVNIVEVICHENVKKVEEYAFIKCPFLSRVIMPGVEVVGINAFCECEALADVECGKLERIRGSAFRYCNSLRSIDLSSAKIIESYAFADTALKDATFGSKLDRIEEAAFCYCTSLARITIPLKDGIIAAADTFIGCDNLKHVDLVEGAILETIAALQLEEWRNDMSEEIVSINQILPSARAGSGWDANVRDFDEGDKARVIWTWIRSVLRRIIHYKAEHRRLLDEEAASTLQLALPRDIVMNNVLPFLDCHRDTFEVADHGEEEDDSDGEKEEE